VITPPAGAKGVTRAGNPFIGANLQTLQTQANNSELLASLSLFAQQNR
jgi:hypothetical protein